MIKKSFFLITLLSFLSLSNVFGQQKSNSIHEDQAMKYRLKAMKYDNLKGTGSSLMIVGGVSFFSGIGLMASADWYTDASGYRVTDDDRFLYGFLLMPASIIFSAAGTIFYIVGRKKHATYMKKAQTISVQANSNGIGISIKF
ncbi:MAG: hypothetical protein OEX22_11605 [Cyclobacteriaceae bacterium]|nr:hypothetical protein [Cyclobacteriaceae bacterium]